MKGCKGTNSGSRVHGDEVLLKLFKILSKVENLIYKITLLCA